MEALRERIQELEEQLGIVSTEADGLFRLPVTAMQTRMLGVLMKFDLCSRERLFFALYSDRPDSNWPDDRLIDVQISHIRKKLAPRSISIKTKWGQGWYMEAEDKQKVRDWVLELTTYDETNWPCHA